MRDALFLIVALILAGLCMQWVPVAVDEELAIKDREMKKVKLEMAREVVRRIEEEGREMVNKARREKDGPTHRR
jgi:hypothetical protein